MCFDVMHDIFEGICRYEIAKILNNLINIEKLFSLNTLNNRIRFHNDKNISPAINETLLKIKIFF